MKCPLKWHNQPEKNNKGLLESLQQHQSKINEKAKKRYSCKDGLNTDKDMAYSSK